MRKRFGALLLAALMILSAAGCGIKEPEETAEPTIPAPVEIEVPYETESRTKKYEGVELRMASVLEEDDPQAQVMQQAAETFGKLTGAKIQILWAADTASGTEDCDIFQTPLQELHGAPLDQALDLTEMAQTAGYEQHSFEVLRLQVRAQCGCLAAIPQIPYVGGIYYVQDAFETAGIDAAPETWEDFLEVCRILKEAGFEPLALNTEDMALAAQLHMEQILGSSGLIKDPEDKSKFADDKKVTEGAQQILDFVSAGNLLTAAYPGGQNLLGLSNAAMTAGTNALCAEVENGTYTDLNWGVFPWPGTGAGSGSYAQCDVLCVNSASHNPQAAFDFIMLLCTGEFDQLRADVSGGIPADPDNVSAIAGAVQLLGGGQSGDGRLTEGIPAEPFAKLWTGKYKTAARFASDWDKSR